MIRANISAGRALDESRQKPLLPVGGSAVVGAFGGLCARTVCRAPGANWYNRGSLRYYCAACANWLNTDEFNVVEAQKLFGSTLCVLETPEMAADKIVKP